MSGGQDGRGLVGGPHFIYLAHNAKESSTPGHGWRKRPINSQGTRRSDGRHWPGIGRGDESRCRRRSGDHPRHSPRSSRPDSRPGTQATGGRDARNLAGYIAGHGALV
jgi:hypothetical protein